MFNIVYSGVAMRVSSEKQNLSEGEGQLDLIFRALGDRTRRALLARLADKPEMVTELAQPFSMSLPAVSRTTPRRKGELRQELRDKQWLTARGRKSGDTGCPQDHSGESGAPVCGVDHSGTAQ